MEGYSARLKNLPAVIITVFCLLAAFEISTLGQSQRQMIAIQRRIDTMNRQATDYERDNMANDKKGDADRAMNAKRAKLIRAEIEEDLNTLQAAYNDAVTALQTKGDVGSDFARESASKVKKHASRLKNNLSLPEPDKEEKLSPEALPDETRAALTILCKRIYEFITNPIFESHAGLDLEQAAKARRDLDSIIRFSDKLAGN